MEEKTCNKCGQLKPLSDFTRSARGKYGYKAVCKICWAAYMREYYESNPDARAGRSSYHKNLRNKHKEQVFDMLGTECACCGEADKRFLTLDHVNNDGADHRRELGGGKGSGGPDKVWRWLAKNPEASDRFQILCYNCNCAKQYTGLGVCPHQVDAQVYEGVSK